MRDELAAILRATGVTVLLVTHEQEEAFSLADRVALMRDGPDRPDRRAGGDLLRPATRWAAEFVGAANVLPGRLDDGLVETARRPLPGAERRRRREPSRCSSGPSCSSSAVDPAGEGEVVCREFRGHDVFYRVRLADGTTVCSQRPSNEHDPARRARGVCGRTRAVSPSSTNPLRASSLTPSRGRG